MPAVKQAVCLRGNRCSSRLLPGVCPIGAADAPDELRAGVTEPSRAVGFLAHFLCHIEQVHFSTAFLGPRNDS